MIKVVLDTNVVVSAAICPGRKPSAILHLCLTGKGVQLCASEVVFDEYESVLMRPKFGLAPAKVKALTTRIRECALAVEEPEQRTPSVSSLVKHADDAIFLECAASAGAHFLVTGNTRHFVVTRFGPTRIVTPSEFVDLFLR